nr:ORF1 [Erysiphe necator associated bunya-like virus 1]
MDSRDFLNQMTIRLLFYRLFDLPPEIYSQMKDEIIVRCGNVFFNSVEKVCQVFYILPEDCTKESVFSQIAQIWELDSVPEEFSDDLISKLGIGFCYLLGLKPEIRAAALQRLLAFPTLYDYLNLYENFSKPFFLRTVSSDNLATDEVFGHMIVQQGQYREISLSDQVLFQITCRTCGCVEANIWWTNDKTSKCTNSCNQKQIICTPLNEKDYVIRMGGVFDSFRSRRSSKSTKTSGTKRPKSVSTDNHEESQVLNFKKSIKGDGIEPDMSRDLFSVPKPEQVETMTDHLSNHKAGDMFPYLAVVGNEEESKDSRLSRLRAFKSPYGKENKPEVRINGVILDELEGTIVVKDLKDYVDQDRLTRHEAKQNKRFKPLAESSFKKPYILISRITGEYVPLMSSSADYTDLYFTLEDGRLLEHQTIVQSNKLPTNQNGVFELSCDYCINVKDLSQLSLKYFLSRPIMKDGFQWGSISLTIRMSESDTPYLIPKVEAMAIVRAPYTTLEEKERDPDHADVVFTSGQIEKFRELYRSGDIVDVDEPKKVRTKKSSYSKSTIRGTPKGDAGPDHIGEQEGWEHLKGMIKPRLEDGVASVSVLSDENEDDISVPQFTKEQYLKQQEELRKQFSPPKSDSTEDISDRDVLRSSSPASERPMTPLNSVLESKPRKKLRFSDEEEENYESPDTQNVFRFD